MIGRILFVIYVLLLVYFLFFAEIYGRDSFAEQDYRYNLVPFQEIRRFWFYRHKVGFLASFLNLAGNVIGFWPFGFFLPVMHRKMRSAWLVTLLGFAFSLGVESVQLMINGETNVNFSENISFAAPLARNMEYVGGETN